MLKGCTHVSVNVEGAKIDTELRRIVKKGCESVLGVCIESFKIGTPVAWAESNLRTMKA